MVPGLNRFACQENQVLGTSSSLSAEMGRTSFSDQTRTSNLTELSSHPVDLLIVGAGITGAGVARDAAMRGLRAAVVDQGDFGSGTSSKSSRLVHGGLRYLEMADFKLVFEASRERRTLLRIAPHLVWPQSFIFPVHSNARVSLWKLAAGLWIYDALAAFRNVSRHEMLSKSHLSLTEPGLSVNGLKGGARYFDAQCNDARLTLANVISAHRHGALAANYARVREIDLDPRGAVALLEDRISGSTFEVRAKTIVNSTGPWSDRLRSRLGEEALLRPTKGVHVSVPQSRLGNNEAITFTSPLDGRVMFILPWGELSYVGTTDTDCAELPDRARATEEDVIYLLRSANSVFPRARLTTDDVISTWAGLRPLLKPEDPRDPSSVSREHLIIRERPGLVSVLGGKLTTYRQMAAEVVDAVVQDLEDKGVSVGERSNGTDREHLPGGDLGNAPALKQELRSAGISEKCVEHLFRSYGSEAPEVLRLAAESPERQEPLHPDHPALAAEARYAARHEMAQTVKDFLTRRTHLFYEVSNQGTDQAERVAEILAEELHWDEDRRRREVEAYLAVVAENRQFRREGK